VRGGTSTDSQIERIVDRIENIWDLTVLNAKSFAFDCLQFIGMKNAQLESYGSENMYMLAR
jgi:hypothetical protein